MQCRTSLGKATVAALVLTVVFSLPAPGQQFADPAGDPADDPSVSSAPEAPRTGLAAPSAQGSEARLASLFRQLQSPEADTPEIEAEILDLWSRSNSPSMDLLLQRGDGALAQGDLEGAIGFYSALIDHAPDFAEGYAARAVAWMQAGQPGPALSDVEGALALEPRHFGALRSLALLLEDLGSPDEALQAWRMMARLTPHDAEVQEALTRLASPQEGQAL